tara:strand:- start:63 stop:260 length:198 start_codon:yes stop_codon:yes gene_type:complete
MDYLEPNFDKRPQNYEEFKRMEKIYFNLISPYVDTESAIMYSKVVRELYVYKKENYELKQQLDKH